MKLLTIMFTGLETLSACGDLGQAGDACASDGDREEGLECHIEDHGDEEEGEDEGVCEEEGAHDDE